MSKTQDAYEQAAADFVKAKNGKDAAAYVKAKQKLTKARAALRVARETEGTVSPAAVQARAAVNNGG